MQLYETMVNNQGVHIHVTEVHRDLRNEQTSLVVIPDCPSRPRIISPLWKSCRPGILLSSRFAAGAEVTRLLRVIRSKTISATLMRRFVILNLSISYSWDILEGCPIN